MARRSNYADDDRQETVLGDPMPLRLGGHIGPGCARKFDPSTGTATSVHGPRLHFLPEELDLHGDWSWKPARDRAIGYGENSTFRALLGVQPPKGAAELYRGQVFTRA